MNRFLILSLSVVVCCVGLSFVLNLPGLQQLQGDELTYWLAAQKIYSDFSPDETRPLLIALIHGFPLLFGVSGLGQVNSWVIALNLMFWGATITMVHLIAGERIGKWKALALSVLLLFCVGYLAVCFKFLSESVFIGMLVLALYLIRKFMGSRNPDFLAAAFGILALMVLVKPLAIGLILIFISFFFRNFPSIAASKYSAIVLMSIGLLFFQMNSLKKTKGDFTISYIDAFTYYNYLGAKADCFKLDQKYKQCSGERYEKFIRLNSSEQKKAAHKDFIDQLRHNFPNLVKAFGWNLYSNAFGGSSVIRFADARNASLQDILFRLSKFQNILMTLTGALLSFFNLSRFWKTDKFNLLLSVFFLYIWLVSGISAHQGDRFSIVFYAIVLLQIVFCDMKALRRRHMNTESSNT